MDVVSKHGTFAAGLAEIMLSDCLLSRQCHDTNRNNAERDNIIEGLTNLWTKHIALYVHKLRVTESSTVGKWQRISTPECSLDYM